MGFFKKLKNLKAAYDKFDKYSNKYNKLDNHKLSNIKAKVKTYVITDGHKYKIGKSVDPKRRINELTKNSSAYEIKTILIFPYDIEKELHKFFEAQRDNGEWFDLNLTNIDFLYSLKTMSKRQAVKILEL
jgi:hypothetical protein